MLGDIEDISALLMVGISFLIIIYVFFEMIIKPLKKDYREKKEEAAI